LTPKAQPNAPIGDIGVARKRSAAPPVHPPQASASQQNASPVTPGAPPVYRPFALTSQLKPAGAPPVYRPTSVSSQRKASPATPPHSGARPVYCRILEAGAERLEHRAAASASGGITGVSGSWPRPAENTVAGISVSVSAAAMANRLRQGASPASAAIQRMVSEPMDVVYRPSSPPGSPGPDRRAMSATVSSAKAAEDIGFVVCLVKEMRRNGINVQAGGSFAASVAYSAPKQPQDLDLDFKTADHLKMGVDFLNRQPTFGIDSHTWTVRVVALNPISGGNCTGTISVTSGVYSRVLSIDLVSEEAFPGTVNSGTNALYDFKILLVNYLDRMVQKPFVATQKGDADQIIALLRTKSLLYGRDQSRLPDFIRYLDRVLEEGILDSVKRDLCKRELNVILVSMRWLAP
jgi:hypothetical protein